MIVISKNPVQISRLLRPTHHTALLADLKKRVFGAACDAMRCRRGNEFIGLKDLTRFCRFLQHSSTSCRLRSLFLALSGSSERYVSR